MAQVVDLADFIINLADRAVMISYSRKKNYHAPSAATIKANTSDET